MTRTVNDVIDALGLGFCQVRLLLLAGGIYLVGGEFLFLFSTLSGAVATEFTLNGYQRALLASIPFIGMLAGNLTCAFYDQYGRRWPIILALFGICVCTAASAIASSYWLIVALWGMAGFAYGIGVPTWNALCTETSPAISRFLLNSLSLSIFSSGSLHAALVVYQYAPDLRSVSHHWRSILLWERVPNLLILVLAICPGFVESPHLLLATGQKAEADKQLDAMRRQNNKPTVSIEYSYCPPKDAPSMSSWESLCFLFSRALRSTTFTIGFTTFMLNFVSFGAMYTLPHVLSTVNLGMSAALSLATATIFEFIGFLVGIKLEEHLGRRPLMLIYLSGCALCTILFVLGVQLLQANVESAHGIWLVQLGINGARIFLSIGWEAAYVCAGEAFPTVVRASASGVCIGCGRLGSLAAPLLFEHILTITGGYLTFFIIIGAGCVTNTIIVLFVLQETKGVALDDAAVAALPLKVANVFSKI